MLAALLAVPYTARAARAARAQTRIQEQVRKDAAQPYVWADIRPSPQHGQLLLLVVSNSGKTVATNVRVTVTGIDHQQNGAIAQQVLQEGLPALPPGRELVWSLAQPWNFIKSEGHRVDFVITADGPFGPVEELRYTIDLAGHRDTTGVPPGTLHGISDALSKLAKELSKSAQFSARTISEGLAASEDRHSAAIRRRLPGARPARRRQA